MAKAVGLRLNISAQIESINDASAGLRSIFKIYAVGMRREHAFRAIFTPLHSGLVNLPIYTEAPNTETRPSACSSREAEGLAHSTAFGCYCSSIRSGPRTAQDSF